MRATSSIRSASIAMSKRCGGGVTRQPSCVDVDLHLQALQARAHTCVVGTATPSRRANCLRRSVTGRPRRQVLVGLRHGNRTGAARRLSPAAARARARSRAPAATGSTPRSKRWLASVVRPQAPRAPDDRRRERSTLTSKNTSVVSALTAVRSPPMMPARPTGPALVGDQQHVRLERRLCLPSSSVSVSPGARKAGADARRAASPGRRRASAGQLEHHVVGDVHHRTDRAHTRAPQPLAHPERGAARVVDAANDAADEASGMPAGASSAHAKAIAQCAARAGDRCGRSPAAARRIAPPPRARYR